MMMNTLDLNFICNTLKLPAPQHNQTIKRVIIDSRLAQQGDLFVALLGENHDAHDFVNEVLAKGALALVSREDCAHLSGCLKVDNTLIALQQLSAKWRTQSQALIFGITGSSGKTTVKEMLANILRTTFGEEAVLSTAGNLNNHIGLPLTLLNLKAHHRFAVIEMGMSGFGELALLTRLAAPNIALVNNAMSAHIGCGFNGVADIARAKSEIYQGLPPKQGIAILPKEDKHFAIFQAATENFTTQTFGLHTGDVYAQDIVLNDLSSDFILCSGSLKEAIHLPVAGEHNISNACAAAALALAGGLSLPQIAQGLSSFQNIKGRLQNKKGKKNSLILDDTYNANPDSMKAALNVLAKLPAPRIFVMGDMGELGEDNAAKMHEEIGIYARDLGIEYAYFVGKHSIQAAKQFGNNGLWFDEKTPLLADLIHRLPEKASILVKGSRFMQMETIVDALLDTVQQK